MNKDIMSKAVVLSVIFLFIGVGIQPVFAVNHISNTNTIQEEEIKQVGYMEDAKDFLFQTIIEIANNPDVKDLLKGNKELFTSNYDYESVFNELLLKKPLLLFLMIFSKPSISYEYLDTSYNRGNKIINLLGNEKATEIISSINITNPELFDDLQNIIDNNEDFANRFIILESMNENLTLGDPPFPIICAIIDLMLIALVIPLGIIELLMTIFYMEGHPEMVDLLLNFYYGYILLSSPIWAPLFLMFVVLGCWEWPDPW